jgi:hypothetical protein
MSKVELGRYRYFKSVSVFGIFSVFLKVGIRYSVSVVQNTAVSVSVFFNSYKTYQLKTLISLWKAYYWHYHRQGLRDEWISRHKQYKLNSLLINILYRPKQSYNNIRARCHFRWLKSELVSLHRTRPTTTSPKEAYIDYSQGARDGQWMFIYLLCKN